MILRSLLLVFMISSLASAQTWMPVGPSLVDSVIPIEGEISGRITAVAAHPTDKNTIYIGAAGGGVWKTTDGIPLWSPLTDSQATTAIGALAIAPSNPDVIYAGTGDALNASDSIFGRGILISSNGGNTWTLATGPGNAFDRLSTSKIVVDPTNPNVAYAAIANSTAYRLLGSSNTGIWKTTDGGTTWTDTSTGITTTNDWLDLATNPSNPAILYASLYAGGGSGVYKSTNRGSTWSLLTNGPNGSAVVRITIAIAPTNPQVVYVSSSTSGGGLGKFMRSDDGGATFTDLTSGTPNYLDSSGYFNTTLIVDPSNAAIVYAGGATSLIRSTDGGVSWTDMTSNVADMRPHCCHHGIAFDAAGRLLDGTDGGIYRLDDPTTRSWFNMNRNLQTIQFYGIGLHPTDQNKMLGGTQGNGLEVFSGSVRWTETTGADAFYVKFSSTNGNRAYYSGGGMPLLFRSDNGGSGWSAKSPVDSGASNLFVPFAVDPANGDRVILGGGQVWETTSAGDSWTAISPPFNFLTAVAIAPSDANTIYAGKGSTIFVTTDHGASWTQQNLPTSGLGINDIQVDPDNSQIAYAVPAGFFNNTGTGHHVYRTTDGGTTWSDISGNLPNEPAWTIQIDPTTSPKRLYLGVNDGVFFSTDFGTTWTRFGTGLPRAQVRQLEFNKTLHILSASTHGRSAWIMHTAGFTDDPLVQNTTIVRLVHLKELRGRIDSLRLRYGQNAFLWTDSNPLPGQTPIRAVHLTEMRSALNGAYFAAGLPTPTYTDDPLMGGTTVKAIHFTELRAAVINLEGTPQ
jgi:photosystem II stability/assembly factor-like uncharacterized protein